MASGRLGPRADAVLDARVVRRRRLVAALDRTGRPAGVVGRVVVVWSPRARIAAWCVTTGRRRRS